ncbi:MAG TPA: metallophosphoesterase [Sporosarcina sp.]|nr:metallophosphoesterase [Sporosarcina sp.]
MRIKKIVTMMIAIIVSMVTRMFFIAKQNRVLTYTLDVRRQREERGQLTVFFITDLHRRKIARALIKQIQMPVDYVIIGGDLAERNVPLRRIAYNLKRLRSIAPIYYVWGNNDREVDEEKIRALCAKYGIRILEDEHEPLLHHIGWGICGTEDPSSEAINIPQAVAGADCYEHLLFVSHQPVVWHFVEPLLHPTIMLAGHTHGGQIRFGKFGISAKGRLIEQDGRYRLVSNGYGTTKLPLRLGAHPESHLLCIRY